jgi:methionyl-tRNA formyltransferase
MTKVVFFGNERLVSGLEKADTPILRGLIERGYEVVAIVSHYSDSQSRNNRELEVAELAKKHDIPLFTPNKPSEIIEELREYNADIAVLAAYGRIVSQTIIDLFPKGIINIHPSLLPQYRGPTPIESAILNGDSITGISIMQLTAGMDEGPVYKQHEIHLNGDETKFDLYQKIIDIIPELFFDTLPQIIKGTLKPQPQSTSDVIYCSLIKKADGNISWSKTARQIEREMRAYLGWPQSRTKINDIDVIITKAHVAEGSAKPGEIIIEDKTLAIGTHSGLLAIDTIKPLGKKEMPVQAFLSGYKSKLL